MVRLAVSVEGVTEEHFVNRMLAPHLQGREIYVVPSLLGEDGGDVSLPRVREDLNSLAGQFDKVTTMYDFYGFKGKKPGETKHDLEQRILDSVHSQRRGKVVPYVQMHEFEGLLFSSPEAIGKVLNREKACRLAQKVLDKFRGDPEKINDSADTAPSRRLLGFGCGYAKAAHGPDIAEEIGLDVMRQKCAGFGAWLETLEQL